MKTPRIMELRPHILTLSCLFFTFSAMAQVDERTPHQFAMEDHGIKQRTALTSENNVSPMEWHENKVLLEITPTEAEERPIAQDPIFNKELDEGWIDMDGSSRQSDLWSK